eukprot:6917178-Ditylum_brightwellii.AAC.1
MMVLTETMVMKLEILPQSLAVVVINNHEADGKNNEADNKNKDNTDTVDCVALAILASSTMCLFGLGIEESTDSCIIASGE